LRKAAVAAGAAAVVGEVVAGAARGWVAEAALGWEAVVCLARHRRWAALHRLAAARDREEAFRAPPGPWAALARAALVAVSREELVQEALEERARAVVLRLLV
jgi:hypothetical protein